jgi:hypothetical protein
MTEEELKDLLYKMWWIAQGNNTQKYIRTVTEIVDVFHELQTENSKFKDCLNAKEYKNGNS